MNWNLHDLDFECSESVSPSVLGGIVNFPGLFFLRFPPSLLTLYRDEEPMLPTLLVLPLCLCWPGNEMMIIFQRSKVKQSNEK